MAGVWWLVFAREGDEGRREQEQEQEQEQDERNQKLLEGVGKMWVYIWFFFIIERDK